MCFRRRTSSELENGPSLSTLFISGKSQMGRYHGNKLVMEIVKYYASLDNLMPGGICEPAPHSDGALPTWNSPRGEVLDVCNQYQRPCAARILIG
ncbi:hypothetical protein AVEN_119282-1 [Araneus ventricosus]|uniref:Uncharacterized protein n=1 Tax=Araneus ventricosus TaxID=182803 RepID=A0A4Y2EIW3_ARAVE|nr:hypothetical protein AVEN_119282-1 [Araneus ventricosus]